MAYKHNESGREPAVLARLRKARERINAPHEESISMCRDQNHLTLTVNHPQQIQSRKHSMFTVHLAIAAALTGLATAQNYSISGPLAIDPNSVSLDLRTSWCTEQKTSCYKICGGGADASLGDAYPNQCDTGDLSWTCTCVNGNQPNISDYRSTMPYFVCLTWRDDCTAAHPNDLSGQADCQSVTCGSRDPDKAKVVGSSSGSSSSASIGASSSSSALASSSLRPISSSASATSSSQPSRTTKPESTSSSSAPDSSAQTPATNTNNPPANKGLSSGALIGIGVGVGIGLAALLAALAYTFWFRRRRPQAQKEEARVTGPEPADSLDKRGGVELENPPSELAVGHMAQELPARHGVSELGRNGSSTKWGGVESRHEMQ